MLRLWRPSGVDSGTDGLRLAIRNDYLNFYRLGQSVACVKIHSDGRPTAKVHTKYLGGSSDEYLELRGDQIWSRSGPRAYKRGGADLQSWIDMVNTNYAGAEKKFVDRLVTANPDVIDLEMGLPVWGEQQSAPRMDLVAIEGGRKVVFWEAKLVSDGRLRCKPPVKKDSMPKVLEQLAKYRKFLCDPTYGARHIELVETAYRSAARGMKTLWEMAGSPRQMPLGEAILKAADESTLEVDRTPRLVVYDDDSSKSWPPHEAKLRNEPGVPHVSMIVVRDGKSFVLRYPS